MKTLRQSSTGHAYALPLPALTSVSFVVGTARPLAFFVRFGTATGLGRRESLRPAIPVFLIGVFCDWGSQGSSKTTKAGVGGEDATFASGENVKACDWKGIGEVWGIESGL